MGRDKWCPRCGDFRPLESFGRNAARRDGLTQYCKKHANAYRQRGRAPDRDAGRPPADGERIIARQRRRELESLGGAEGVRALERRMALARSLKRAACGRSLPDGVLERVSRLAGC